MAREGEVCRILPIVVELLGLIPIAKAWQRYHGVVVDVSIL